MTDTARQTDLFPKPDSSFVSAVLSPNGIYRYELRREVEPGAWSRGGPLALFCGANPSTADAHDDDHTIRKEIGFAARWGCDGLIKLNLFPWRSTDPDLVPRGIESWGQPENELHIAAALAEPRVSIVVACWGDCLNGHPWLAHASAHFLSLLKRSGRSAQCFGLTKSGNPKHPLTLKYSTPVVPFANPYRSTP